MIHEDGRFTVRMLATEDQTSKDSVHRILKEDLHMNKVCARWVPRLLSTEHKTKRVSCSREASKVMWENVTCARSPLVPLFQSM